MACTKAVEEVIDGHYARQERALGGEEPEFRETIREFRADELGHRDTARGRGCGRAGIPLAQAVGSRVDPARYLAVGTVLIADGSVCNGKAMGVAPY